MGNLLSNQLPNVETYVSSFTMSIPELKNSIDVLSPCENMISIPISSWNLLIEAQIFNDGLQNGLDGFFSHKIGHTPIPMLESFDEHRREVFFKLFSYCIRFIHVLTKFKNFPDNKRCSQQLDVVSLLDDSDDLRVSYAVRAALSFCRISSLMSISKILLTAIPSSPSFTFSIQTASLIFWNQLYFNLVVQSNQFAIASLKHPPLTPMQFLTRHIMLRGASPSDIFSLCIATGADIVAQEMLSDRNVFCLNDSPRLRTDLLFGLLARSRDIVDLPYSLLHALPPNLLAKLEMHHDCTTSADNTISRCDRLIFVLIENCRDDLLEVDEISGISPLQLIICDKNLNLLKLWLFAFPHAQTRHIVRRALTSKSSSSGVEMMSRDGWHPGATPLHIAASVGWLEGAELLLSACKNTRESDISLYDLIRAQDVCGLTPLHFAVRANNAALVTLLVSVDENGQKNNQCVDDCEEDFQKLLICIKDTAIGCTPIHYAAGVAHLQHLVPLLLSLPDLQSNSELKANKMSDIHLKKRKFILEQIDIRGQTALHHLITAGCFDATLLNLLSTPRAWLAIKETTQGRSALHIAAAWSNWVALKVCLNCPGVKEVITSIVKSANPDEMQVLLDDKGLNALGAGLSGWRLAMFACALEILGDLRRKRDPKGDKHSSDSITSRSPSVCANSNEEISNLSFKSSDEWEFSDIAFKRVIFVSLCHSYALGDLLIVFGNAIKGRGIVDVRSQHEQENIVPAMDENHLISRDDANNELNISE